MSALVMNCGLNPLAPCFVPSNSLKMVRKDEGIISLPNVSENKMKAVPKKLSKDENSSDVETKDFVRLIILDHGIKIGLLLQESTMAKILRDVSTSRLCAYLESIKQIYTKSVDQMKNLELLSLPECLNGYGQEIDRTGYKNVIEAPETSELKKEEKDKACQCPVMFGWIIPPGFLGNPFNFKYYCNKRYAHIATSVEENKRTAVKMASLDTIINGLTVDQCSLEIKDILTDVYESVGNDPDPISKWEEKYKIQDFLEVSDDELDDECDEPNRFSWNPAPNSEISSASELVDDGCHPLLQSISKTADVNEVSIDGIEKILGDSLLPEEPQSLDCAALDSKTVCNPPCSVWCDCLPSAAKDTFKKFLKKSERTNGIRFEGKPVGERPLYKRSFSADDAPNYVQFSRSLFHQTSIAESRERLILLRKDPVSYFRHHAYNTLKDGKRQYRSSSDLSDFQLRGNLNKGDSSKMWGPFDGADSLWQPLPDCVPSNEHNTKQNCHKRAREIRRQRSVN